MTHAKWDIQEAERRTGPWRSISRPMADDNVGFYIISHALNGWKLVGHTKSRFVFHLEYPPPRDWGGYVYHRFIRLASD